VYRVSELAQPTGIAQDGVKWLKRFEEEGPGGLRSELQWPRRWWNRTETTVEEALVAFRKEARGLGSEKDPRRVGEGQPDVEWPARARWQRS